MVEISLPKGHTVKLYNSAQELPMRRYSQFQKYNLMESGIGSNISSIGMHFVKLNEYIGYSMQEEATVEVKNLFYNFFTMLTELNIPGLAFCCLLHSVDGVEVHDLSEESLKGLVQRLSDYGMSQDVCMEWVEGVKKKYIQS